MATMSRLSRWWAGATASPALPHEPPTPHLPPEGADWRLWRLASGGCAASARELVKALSPQAMSLAWQMLGQREDAQDAVQDAFLRLWRSEPRDTHGARLSTYFNTIVINRCRSVLVQRRERAATPEELAHWAASEAQEGQPGHANRHIEAVAWTAAGASERLQAAMASLPPRQRTALSMWAYADATAADIAHALDIDPNAAHQLLHRARQALRARFEGGAP